MKIAVIGAGVIGITTAYELAAQGHQVSVFDRNSSCAEESSFANAGVISPGYTSPWAKPGMIWYVLRYMWQRDTPVRVFKPNLTELHWLWQWQKACNPESFAANRARMMRLALYSQHRLHTLTDTLGLDHERGSGHMVLLRSERESQLMQASLEVMRDAGLSFKSLSSDEARQIEPALNPNTALAQAIYFPDDEVGNCRQFTLLLKAQAETLGVKFHFNTPIAALQRTQPRTIHKTTNNTSETFDAVVMCAGVASAQLLRPLGLRIPLAAIQGYSISAPIREPLDAPKSSVMDERYKVTFSRLGQRIRISGGAEVGGDLRKHHAGSIQTLYRVLEDWFPGAARTQDSVQVWKGVRPMLPDGPPLIGPSGVDGVWLNLGHGSSGWALSCGSAKAVADQIGGRKPEVNLEGLGLERLK
jgi:D-amino-acid dehydrogenase